MDNSYITVRSVTYAQRGEKLLRQSGVDCALQRTPKWMEQRGCGYCLRLRGAMVHRALELLHQAKVPMRRVYTNGPGGEMKELVL